MKVLILSCSTGEGHNSAGNAVREYFALKNIHCDVINAFSFVSDVLSDVISKGHVFVYRNMPRLFGAGYKIEEKHPPKAFYRIMSRGADGMYDYIVKGGYDTVICSHIFAAMTLTECKRKYGCNVASYLLVTDYTCSPGVNMLDMDAYFIPHELLTDEFINNGIAPDRIIPSGIPISQKFFGKKPKNLSRSELGIAGDVDVVLLSSGSMGCGPMYELTMGLLDSLHYSTELCVVCGNNQKLYSALSPLAKDKRLRLCGFTPKMYDYMNSADVYITKAGGLSTTEAISVGVPLILMNAVPGCESHNLEFMTKSGCAVTADNVGALTALVSEILEDKQTSRVKFSTNQEKYIKNGAENVYNSVVGSRRKGI